MLETVDSMELARLVLDCIAEKVGVNTVILDIQSVSLLGDYFVISSGESERQIRAIIEEIRFQVKGKLQVIPLRVEGAASSGWVLMDYGSVIVHVFSPAMRDYYRLESLWSDAPVKVKMQ